MKIFLKKQPKKSPTKSGNIINRKKIIKKKTLHLIGFLLVLTALIILLIANWDSLKFMSAKIIDTKLFNPTTDKDKYQMLLNQLAKEQIPVSYLHFTNSEILEASLSSGVKVIFSLDKDIISEVTSLQLILSRFRIEGRKVNRIDLRFKNAVVE